MGSKISSNLSKIDQIIPLLVLLFLLPYTYAHFRVRPYFGMVLDPITGVIEVVFNQESSTEKLLIGDKVIRVGSIPWIEFTGKVITPGEEILPGRQLFLTIQRDQLEFATGWIIPPITRQEQLERFKEAWWLGYVFWIAGTIVVYFIRPRNSRRILLAVFLYLGAIWLTAGRVSGWGIGGIWRSSSILHASFWLLMPISLHFHWNFPNPLARPPKYWWLIYVVGISLAIADWFHLLPGTAYLIGGLIAAIGSIVLLFLHAFLQPKHRRDVIPLVLLIGLAFLPTIIIGFIWLLNPYTSITYLPLVTLVAIPWAYIFAVYRRQFGDMELSHNRIVSVIIFLVVLIILFTIFGVLIIILFEHVNSAGIFGLIILSAILSSILSIFFYSPFQRLIERYFIGIPIDPSHLLETYSAQIATSLNKDSLSQILAEDMIPSLLVKQSILFRYKGENEIQTMYTSGLTENEMPNSRMVKKALQDSGTIRFLTFPEGENAPHPWVRLIIPLKIKNKLIGAWLLGRHNPDDFYSKTEINTLLAIADQTAVALTNIDQAEYLHALYQNNIDRQEVERQKLALELHDQVLGQLAVMIMNPKDEYQPDQLNEACLDIAARIREMVEGLRPAMLNYGLDHALDELCDNISELSDDNLFVEIDIPLSGIRYPTQSELHLYRIIQQACYNTLHHAHATNLSIKGRLDLNLVDLIVEDDGIGFVIENQLDLPSLLSNRKFGIVGMFERASLIGAELDISSQPGNGTRVRVKWKPLDAQKESGEADYITSIEAR